MPATWPAQQKVFKVTFLFEYFSPRAYFSPCVLLSFALSLLRFQLDTCNMRIFTLSWQKSGIVYLGKEWKIPLLFFLLPSTLLVFEIQHHTQLMSQPRNVVKFHFLCNGRYFMCLLSSSTGATVVDPPLPFMSPFAATTEQEINKQINRELFASYTYLSMVSF